MNGWMMTRPNDWLTNESMLDEQIKEMGWENK